MLVAPSLLLVVARVAPNSPPKRGSALLPLKHRITDGADFRRLQRKGTRRATDFFVASIVRTDSARPSRCGFVVSKNVGGAVVRNRVRRQLRALAGVTISSSPTGVDIVIRVLPEAAAASFDQLHAAWREAIDSDLSP